MEIDEGRFAASSVGVETAPRDTLHMASTLRYSLHSKVPTTNDSPPDLHRQLASDIPSILW
ncbi:hypothetical protein E2C01_086601 [Portunus trituberculatus]|uniref:Uncharacterized protein n=1 Tax=Portunus trituberculatus TaxID=210409 RepID=A0A5B7JBW9_PORTR|nr:hypothetical protein [Portunus trituberculatus]